MTARIVSLVPSLTELICALGLRDHLVGRTGFCIHPKASLVDVPKVGGTKSVDVERIRALRPTHLIVSREENEQPTVARIARFVPEVVVADARNLEENRALYRQMGDVFNAREAADQLCDAFDTGLLRLMSRHDSPVAVLYLIWKSPWMTVTRNTFISSMLASVGLHSVPDRIGRQDADRYPCIADDALTGQGADVILLSSEPYRFGESHRHEMTAGTGLPCALIDGEMTSWFGSRAIAGLDYLGRFRDALDRTLEQRP